MRPRIGLTLWRDELDVAAPHPVLDAAVAAGAEVLELPLFALDLVVGGRISTENVTCLRRALDAHPVGVTVHGHIAINLMALPDEALRHIEMALCNIDVSAALGAERLVLHCGTCADMPEAIHDARARQQTNLARLGDAAAAAGVLLCIETTTVDPGESTLLASALASDLSALGHPAVVATLDYAHVALECARRGADLLEESMALLPLAPHIHLNDCFGRPCKRGAMMPAEALAYGLGDLHLPIGWGSLPWDALMAMPGYRADTILNLELHARHWSELGASMARLRGFVMDIAPAGGEAAGTSPALERPVLEP